MSARVGENGRNALSPNADARRFELFFWCKNNMHVDHLRFTSLMRSLRFSSISPAVRKYWDNDEKIANSLVHDLKFPAKR